MENPFEIIEHRLDAIEKLIEKVLLRLDQEKPQQDADQNFTIDELAKYLKCSKVTIHRYKKDGMFPFYKAGRKIYFRRSEVDRAMHSLTPVSKGKRQHWT